MLQCAPTMGHVVTFHFHSFGVYQEKSIRCINKTKPHICRRVKLIWEKINILNPK